MIDVSVIDGGDLLVDEEDNQAMAELQRLLWRPQRAGESEPSHRRRNLDLHHAYTAVMQRADLVTLDDDDLWRKRSQILSRAGLRVLHPDEAMSIARGE